MPANLQIFIRTILTASGFCAGLVGSPAMGEEDARLGEVYQKEILPIFVNYCYDCHGDGSAKGDLELDRYATIAEMVADRDQWQKIRDHIDFRLMPPPDEFAPEEEERAKLVGWIDAAVFPVDAENPDPGHVTLRRLNRIEYQNTINDLLGIKVDITDSLPMDDSGYGFDNIGDVLTLSPLHMERYLDAAQSALDLAVDLSAPKFPELIIKGRELKGAGYEDGDDVMMATSGESSLGVRLPASGNYRFKVIAGADHGGDEAAKMELKLDDSILQTWEVNNDSRPGKEFSIEAGVEGGKDLKVAISFLNDFYDEAAPDGKRDRNLLVERIVIEGPLDGPRMPKPEPHLAIYGRRDATWSDEAYLNAVMKRFTERAFRRPLLKGELERYQYFLKSAHAQGENVDYAVRQALAAVLVSPAFLFREEPAIGGNQGGRELIT
ncbi:MAG: DUF1587 domain-containing protein, partial [Armatimonadetes bacterium]|nr:DUF1587 domain-containing protein [Akkermansiaceae bacterium]